MRNVRFTNQKRGMPDEHWGYSAIHNGYGLELACDVLWNLIAITSVLIRDYVDVHVRACGEA